MEDDDAVRAVLGGSGGGAAVRPADPPRRQPAHRRAHDLALPRQRHAIGAFAHPTQKAFLQAYALRLGNTHEVQVASKKENLGAWILKSVMPYQDPISPI